MLERPEVSAEALVRVVRCFSRIVDYGHLSDDVAAEVFRRPDGTWPNPDRDQFDRIADPREPLRGVARLYLNKHSTVLRGSAVVPLKRPPRRRVSVLEALRWLGRMLIGRLKALPVELTERLLAGFVDVAAQSSRIAPAPTGRSTSRARVSARCATAACRRSPRSSSRR